MYKADLFFICRFHFFIDDAPLANISRRWVRDSRPRALAWRNTFEPKCMYIIGELSHSRGARVQYATACQNLEVTSSVVYFCSSYLMISSQTQIKSI